MKSTTSTCSLASKASTRSELAGKIVKRNKLVAQSVQENQEKPAAKDLNKRVDLMIAKEREKQQRL